MSKQIKSSHSALVRTFVWTLALAGAVPCWAATQTVTNTSDSGNGSLRAAIANAASGDIIVFNLPSGSVITLSNTLGISTNLTIQGPGATKLAVSGNQAVEVFYIGSGAIVTISGLTIENGYYIGAGGGVDNAGTLAITNCTLSSNSADYGGAIENYGGTLTITDSTLSGNSAYSDGGAIENSGATVTLTNSTVAANSAQFASAIENFATLIVVNSTLSGNLVGQALDNDDPNSVLTLKSTLLAGNQVGNCANLAPVTSSEGYNLSDDATCSSALTAPTDKNNVPAGLDPKGLQNNGGPTQTVALLPGSPAVDAIPLAACTDTNGNRVTTDQRGITRPQGSGCDIGAFELVENVAFSNFSANLAIATGKLAGFALNSWFTLGTTSNGIHPSTEAVTLQIANYTVTIPAGSFHQLWNSAEAPYAYAGTINGTKLIVGLIPLGHNNYQFDAAGSPVVWSGVKNPVTVSLTIGNDTGTTSVNAVIR